MNHQNIFLPNILSSVSPFLSFDTPASENICNRCVECIHFCKKYLMVHLDLQSNTSDMLVPCSCVHTYIVVDVCNLTILFLFLFLLCLLLGNSPSLYSSHIILVWLCFLRHILHPLLCVDWPGIWLPEWYVKCISL